MDVKDRALINNEQRKVKEIPFKVYHQNIRSLRRKYHELLCYLYPDLPHIILVCLTEHHMNVLEYSHINLAGFTAGAQFKSQVLQTQLHIWLGDNQFQHRLQSLT